MHGRKLSILTPDEEQEESVAFQMFSPKLEDVFQKYSESSRQEKSLTFASQRGDASTQRATTMQDVKRRNNEYHSRRSMPHKFSYTTATDEKTKQTAKNNKAHYYSSTDNELSQMLSNLKEQNYSSNTVRQLDSTSPFKKHSPPQP